MPAERGPSGTGHDTHPEDTCEECGGPNVVWFAPNDLWNRVMRGGDRGAPDAVGIVCPVCFIRRAEALGVKPTGWSVQEENIPPDPPVAVPGPASAQPWGNVTATPVEHTSAGICGMHGSFIGRACAKCVTQPKGPT